LPLFPLANFLAKQKHQGPLQALAPPILKHGSGFARPPQCAGKKQQRHGIPHNVTTYYNWIRFNDQQKTREIKKINVFFK
jgi:hypothetical protein